MAGRSFTIRELLVRLGVDADTKEAKDFDAAIEGVKTTAEELVSTLKWAAAGVAAFVGGLLYQANATAQSARSIERQASALGLTTDAYQELLYAATKYGVEAGDLMDVFGQTAQLATQATQGNKQYTAAFAALGITLDDLKGKNPDQLFTMLADGLGNTKDATLRLAQASTILGEDSAKKLLPLLVHGASGLAQLRKEAHTLGVVMSQESIRTASDFANRVSVLGAVTTSLRNEVGLALIPTLSDLATQMVEWVAQNRELISAKIDEYAQAITKGFRDVRDIFVSLIKTLGGPEGAVRWMERLAAAASILGGAYLAYRVTALALAIGRLVSALSVFGPVLTELGTIGAILGEAASAGVGPLTGAVAALANELNPLVWVATALVAALVELSIPVLLIQDLMVYARGGDSAIGRLRQRILELASAPGILGAFLRVLIEITDTADSLAMLLYQIGSIALTTISNGVRSLVDAFLGFAPVKEILGEVQAVLWSIQYLGVVPLIALVDTLIRKFEALFISVQNGIAGGLRGVRGTLDLATGGLAAGQAVSPGFGGAALAERALIGAQLAPTPSSARGGGTQVTQTVGPTTNVFQGIGASLEQVGALIQSAEDAAARRAAAIFAGGRL